MRFVLVLALALAPIAVAGPGTTYRGHGVAFEYPTGWSKVRPPSPPAQLGGQIWVQWFSPVRTRSVDVVAMAGSQLPVSVTPEMVAALRPALKRAVGGLARQNGGRLVSGPTEARLGSLQGYRFEMTARTSDGKPVRSRLYLAFDRKDEFLLTCQWGHASARAAEIRNGCTRIARSFRRR